MNDKSMNKNLTHQIPAGMLIGDTRTEMFGCRDTKKVFFISNGTTQPFEKLSNLKKSLIFEELLNDNKSMEDLKHLSQEEAIEQYAFCVYGAADHEADFNSNGELNKSDNFICSDNCKCLKWLTKSIKIDNRSLTSRQVQIVTLLATDLCDKQIADQLSISPSTLDSHKTKLFEIFGVHGKTGLIFKAINQKIIQ